jgi:SAM-dependent methyltransferase
VHSTVRFLHNRFVLERRAKALSGLLAGLLLPATAEVLDVGCGDGLVGHLIERNKPTVRVRGLEVMPRASSHIKCLPFDGQTIPLRDGSVDVCLFVDVLHHTLNIAELLREARRVTRRYVLLKDHVCEGLYDRAALSFMDWVGNRPHGVSLPYNYQSREAWEGIFRDCALQIVKWNQDIPLYPLPFNWLFGRGMHCIVLLEKM